MLDCFTINSVMLIKGIEKLNPFYLTKDEDFINSEVSGNKIIIKFIKNDKECIIVIKFNSYNQITNFIKFEVEGYVSGKMIYDDMKVAKAEQDSYYDVLKEITIDVLKSIRGNIKTSSIDYSKQLMKIAKEL